MKIKLDLDKCIGAGLCVQVAPTLFDQNQEDGLARVLNGSPSGGEQENARAAEKICPARAIMISKLE